MQKYTSNNLKSFDLFNHQIITGSINPISWDKYDNPKDFSIYTSDEEDFIIKGVSRKILLGYLGSTVIAKGNVSVNSHGEKVIKVKSLKPITNLPSGGESNNFYVEYSPSVKLMSTYSDNDFTVSNF